ncbi:MULTISPECIES: RDD family protein [Vagococcus]|uniref:RDD domain-containing protein n=1 Tax=Vagococcus fluvialis bH819 TaxID=1255619 RepID=A0A1X6WSN6_9ENTE|nr:MULTISPECIES: RDD family protein [Vagococcus]SLM87242.1 BH3197 unknown conserved protein [Vagococcus fluvialis bH819]HCM89092.1 RDD family protein [Vagococcus sp.]
MEELAEFNDVIKEEIPQKISDFPNYFYAGFWVRLFAFVVDLICISIVTAGTIGLVYKIQGLEKTHSLITIYGIVSLVIYLTYFTLLTKLNDGQTLGKMIFGIKVVSLEEETLSWQTVLIRECVCRFILQTFIFGLGYLVSIFTPKKQHIGDYFSGTSVIIINMIKASGSEIK